MPNTRRFHTFMTKFVPMLLQQKFQEEQVKRWLEKSLQEYEAYGKQQEEVQNRALMNTIIELFVKQGMKGAEDLDLPLLGGLERLKQTGVGEAYPELRLPTPTTTYEEATKPFQELASQYVASQEGVRMPEAQAIINAIRLKGSDFLTDWVKEVAETKQKEAEREVRKGELTETEESRKLREKELTQRKKEYVAGEKGEKKTSELADDLEELSNERWEAISDIADLDPDIDEDKYKTIKSKILNLNDKIKSLKGKLKSDPDKRHAEAAKEIKKQGYSKEDIFKDEGLMRWIDENGLSPWILLEYF